MSGAKRSGPKEGRSGVVGSTTYEIHLAGHLDPAWVEGFGGSDVAWTDRGESIVTAIVPDGAALHGLLGTVLGLGVPLNAVVKRDTLVDGGLARAWRAAAELLRLALDGSDALLLRADRRAGRFACHYVAFDGLKLDADLQGVPGFPDDATWRAFATGELAVARRSAEAGGPRGAVVAVPLLVAGDVVGVLRVASSDPDVDSEDRLVVVRAAAHLLAAALAHDSSSGRPA